MKIEQTFLTIREIQEIQNVSYSKFFIVLKSHNLAFLETVQLGKQDSDEKQNETQLQNRSFFNSCSEKQK